MSGTGLSAADVIVTPEGITVYPPDAEGKPWRAVRYDPDGERRGCRATSETAMAAKLEPVKARIIAEAHRTMAPVSQLVAHYLDPARRPVDKQWAESTRYFETRRCQKILDAIGDRPCGGVKMADVQRLVNGESTAITGGKMMYTLKALVKTGYADGFITNPRLAEVHWQAGNRPMPPRKVQHASEAETFIDPRTLPAHPAVAALAAATQRRRAAKWWEELFIYTAAYTGLRSGELRALRADRLQFSQRLVDVLEKVVEVNGKQFLGLPKGDKIRTTLFPRRTPTGYLLAEQLARREEEVRAEHLSRLIVSTLLPDGAALTVAIDDTLFKKRGKKVFGAAWQHDGASRSDKPVGYGVCFVVMGIIVELPFCSRPFCLPVAAKLWRPKTDTSKVDIAAALVKLIALWHRDARIHVVADAAYHGPALRHLPARITVTTRLPASAVLYDLAPPPTGKRGRPALKGTRLGKPADLAATAKFATVQVRRYGRVDTVHIAEIRCLWYGSFHTQTVRVVLIRDDATNTGYDLALVTTDLVGEAPALVSRYAWRWSIEVTFAETREHLGAVPPGAARDGCDQDTRCTGSKASAADACRGSPCGTAWCGLALSTTSTTAPLSPRAR